MTHVKLDGYTGESFLLALARCAFLQDELSLAERRKDEKPKEYAEIVRLSKLSLDALGAAAWVAFSHEALDYFRSGVRYARERKRNAKKAADAAAKKKARKS